MDQLPQLQLPQLQLPQLPHLTCIELPKAAYADAFFSTPPLPSLHSPHVDSPALEPQLPSPCVVADIDAAIAPTPREQTARLVWCEMCDVCGKQFFKCGSLIRHKRAAHRTRQKSTAAARLNCHICNKSFSQQGSLNRHLRSIHESRKLHCRYCDLAFGQAFDLKRHQRRKHPHAAQVVPREALPVT